MSGEGTDEERDIKISATIMTTENKHDETFTLKTYISRAKKTPIHIQPQKSETNSLAWHSIL